MSELSREEANELLRGSVRKRQQESRGSQWLVQHRGQIERAVKDDRKTIELDGKEFRLIYTPGRVFVKPVKGFVPCGDIEIRRR